MQDSVQQQETDYWKEAQAKEAAFSRLTLPERADSLQRFFKLATDTSTTEKEKYSTLFFVAFPNSFEDLVQLYGYDNEVGSAPLYESAEDHLYLFSNTTTVPHRARLQKQVNIATNGAWEADAVSYFQRELQESVLNDLFSTVQVLQGLSEEQIRQFWYFYFSGPHPSPEIPSSLRAIGTIDPSIYLIMQQVHKQVVIDWEH